MAGTGVGVSANVAGAGAVGAVLSVVTVAGAAAGVVVLAEIVVTGSGSDN